MDPSVRHTISGQEGRKHVDQWRTQGWGEGRGQWSLLPKRFGYQVSAKKWQVPLGPILSGPVICPSKLKHAAPAPLYQSAAPFARSPPPSSAPLNENPGSAPDADLLIRTNPETRCPFTSEKQVQCSRCLLRPHWAERTLNQTMQHWCRARRA